MKANSKIIFTSSFVLALLVTLCFTGCYDRSETLKLSSYMTFYYTTRDFKLTPYHNFDKNGLYAISHAGSYVTPLSKGEDAVLFNELSQKYGDTSYKEIVEIHHIPLPYRSSFSESIANITITSNVDIDEQHPAGSSLNDMFLFFSSSPDQYIKNGYQLLDIDDEAFIGSVDDRFKEEVDMFFQNT